MIRTIPRTLLLGCRLSEILVQTGAESFPTLTPLRREIGTLKGNNHDVALLRMVENRMAQESGLYLLRFRSYRG